VEGNPALAPLNLSIGEPRHPTPAVVTEALTGALDGLSSYPATAGGSALREAIAGWLTRRYGLRAIDPRTQVLPVNGSREALFSFAQTVVDAARGGYVVCPNPFYQIYEGAALLAGATPWFVEQSPEHGFRCDWSGVPESVWQRTQLLYVCSPGNPTGSVMDMDQWKLLFELSDRHGFAIASDECYSEIYFDEADPPLGSLQAAQALGRADFRGLIAFSSLSKRSNAPGMRSGFVAGDPALIAPYLLYRTYHGGAMSLTVQAASSAAWNDEAHVVENRRRYRDKFDALEPVLSGVIGTRRPQAGFYFWAQVPGGDDQGFVRELYRQYNVLALPGSFLGREVGGRNPGRGFVRLALVEPEQACLEAAQRIRHFVQSSRNPT
jgi:N-succinyldiaminopimelate aminotransferase